MKNVVLDVCIESSKTYLKEIIYQKLIGIKYPTPNNPLQNPKNFLTSFAMRSD